MTRADFDCPSCGVFETAVSPVPDAIACPSCGADSPWSATSAADVAGRVKLVSASTGKSDAPPTPYHLDLRGVGTDRSPAEHRAARKKLWREHRWKQSKEFAR